MFQWGWFFLTLLGALAAHLGANVTNDVYDFDTGADQAAHDIMPEGQTLVTGSNMLLNKRLSLRSYRLIAVSCFAVALLCGILLSLIRPYVLVFGVLGFLLAFFYVAPPLRLAYIGRGLGELDILISFGILPVIGSYYVQAGKVSLAAFLVALPIGLYTTAVLYFHHFLHWRADRAVGKITPVVALGERGARFAGALLLLLIAVTIILAIILQALPWYSCIAILTILPVQLRLRKASGDLKNYLQLMATNLNSNVQTALLIVVALIVRGIAHV
jgi:1,4-dihydroxy-2-naphthoate octaprenyltransferase